MESGKVSIIGFDGAISTAREPQPVRFDAAAHDGIVDGEDVYFTRFPDKPDRAKDIWRMTAIAPLYNLAGSPDRLTRQAHTYLLQRVAGFVDAARAMPDDAASHHRTRAEAAMQSVAGLRPEGKVRIGVQAVRAAIDAAAPDQGDT